MQTLTFPHFCQRVSDKMDLRLVPIKEGERKANTALYMLDGKCSIQICFSDFTYGESGTPDYLAEFYDTSNGYYLGAVGTCFDDKVDGVLYEHFEVGVSPSGKYDEHNNPVEVDGELWQFYEGRSLAWAVRSFKMGGARSGRKPVRKW